MAKRPTIDERLSAVFKTRREPSSPESLNVLRDALADKHSVLVEQAARAAKELYAHTLLPELAAAFGRWLDGVVDDRSLLATTALADVLQELRWDESPLFLRGIKLRKPTLPSGDAAAGVRCACAYGLVRSRYRHDVWELTTLLHDKIPQCRVAAAEALSLAGTELAVPLLKFKVLAGDREPEVIGACLSALMSLSPALALPFVAAQLDAEDGAVAESAALALGESRLPDALKELSRRVGTAEPSTRRVILLAVGLLRSEEGIAYLLDRVQHADPRTAADALAALALYKQDAAVKARIATAVETNGSPSVRDAFAREFR